MRTSTAEKNKIDEIFLYKNACIIHRLKATKLMFMNLQVLSS